MRRKVVPLQMSKPVAQRRIRELALETGRIIQGLSELMGCTVQQINRWENNKVKVPKWADRWLRVIYREYADNNPQIRGFVDRLNEADARESARRQFSHEDSAWNEAA
jgi:hypothetical protein